MSILELANQLIQQLLNENVVDLISVLVIGDQFLEEVVASLGDTAGPVFQSVDLLNEVVVVHVSLVEVEEGRVDCKAGVQAI